jgi:anti-sigma factor RsiW
VLTCLRTRRRIGAYLDGALEGAQAASVARHLGECATCQGEATGLRRIQSLLRRSLSPAVAAAAPDWTAFWPGIVRGIEAARAEAPARPRRLWWERRWALGGALGVAVLASVTLWQWDVGEVPPPVEYPVVVNSADTDHPGGSVMVYHTPERDMTVVWVFGLEDE